jgi:methionine-rich copper-binding protein CopC
MFLTVTAKHSAALVLIALLGSAFALQALGHVGLAITVPDHDQVLERAPTQIHFQFMAQVTITNIRLEITDGARTGERINVRLPRNSIGQSTAFGDVIDLPLPALDPATYLVTYQAVSIDGHIMIDDFGFTVSAAP